MKRMIARTTGTTFKGAVLGGVVLGLSALPSVALAQDFYLGGSIGSADPDIGPLDNDVGGKLFVGYRFNQTFAAELGYVMLGDLDFDGGSVDIDGFDLSAIGRLPVSPEWSLYGSVGLFAWDRDVDVASVDFSSDDDVDFTWALGAEYALTDRVGVRAAWQRFLDVEGDIDYLSLGATYGF